MTDREYMCFNNLSPYVTESLSLRHFILTPLSLIVLLSLCLAVISLTHCCCIVNAFMMDDLLIVPAKFCCIKDVVNS